MTSTDHPVGPAPVEHRHPVTSERVPVYAAWPESVGPLLSLGMLTACARRWNRGGLTRTYDIRRPQTGESVLDDLARRDGPAVLLCSNYVWTIEHNLELARAAKAVAPELVVVHGGPSTPKYEGDAERFLDDHHGVADVLVRGEGEETLSELLEVIGGVDGFPLRPERLSGVAGITYRDRSGRVVRTPDRPRIAELDRLPSPYLTGEFDGIPPEAWKYTLAIETNRGCPYGCTFCDWGSATMSRIRKFSIERVAAELRWAAARNIETITITDANFGILARDVEISRILAGIRQRTGAPVSVTWTAAKSTTRHLVKIMDALMPSGIVVSTSLSLQTTDPSTLDVIDRTNISTDHYVKLAAEYRRRGYPVVADLMLGLPGQSFASYKADLQFMLDHEIPPRSWPVQMLPNAPMNAPEYRAEHRLQVGRNNLITSSATFDTGDRERMLRLRTVDTIAERFGLLRHVMRYLQWDMGILASDLEERIVELIEREPTRFPRLGWVFSYFDCYATVAVGWRGFYDEVARLLVEDFGLDPEDSGLQTVLELQRFLMPSPGRPFPDSIDLTHDYLSYYRSATQNLYSTGQAGTPRRPLTDHPPASFTVDGDPMRLCIDGVHPDGDPRGEIMQGDFHMGAEVAYELESALMRKLPALGHFGLDVDLAWVDENPAAQGSVNGNGNGHRPNGRRARRSIPVVTADVDS